jgi:YD repeat-containing protein
LPTTSDAFDAAGRKTKQVRNRTPTTYTYDNADRLTGQQVTGGWATFVMDSVGNILVKSQEGSQPMTMTYDAAQRLTTMQQRSTRTTFSYDNNGSMTLEHVNLSRTKYVNLPEVKLGSGSD